MAGEAMVAEPTGAAATTQTDETPALTFRNYVPRDAALRLGAKEPARAPTTDEVLGEFEQLMAESADQDSLDLTPKKAAWDLRREIERKLTRLDKATQKAIVKLAKQAEQEAEQEGGTEPASG